MRTRYATLVLMLLSACSTEFTPTGPETVFAPIQQPAYWQAARSTDGNACRITSGPAGVYVELDRNGKAKVSSSRQLWAGGFMNIRIAGTKYISIDDSFTPRDSALLLEHFKQEKTAWLEWSEPRGSSGDGLNQRTTRPLELEGFSATLNSCWSKEKTAR